MSVVELNARVEKSVQKYSLPQGVRVAMTHLKELYPKENNEKLYDRLKFRGNPSLSFAKSELSKMEFVETSKGKNVEITLNFLGLFGSASPLPSHYCETILDSADSDRVLSDFLNLFNHHLQKMAYPIWEKQRYYIQYQRDLQDKFSKYMLSILGLYSQTQIKSSKLNFQKLIPYTGILSMRQKSAGTLVSILRHYLEYDKLEIVQCIGMNANIPLWQRSSLGDENCSLGGDFLIGESVRTRSLKFQILLSSIPWHCLYDYSIHGEKTKELQELISLALNEPLEYELCMHIEKDEIRPLELSQHYLGVNSFLGLAENDEKIILSN